MSKNYLLLLLLLFCQIAVAQDYEDWPFYVNYASKGNNNVVTRTCGGQEVKHIEVVSETQGKEYYCSGNLHAEGTIRMLKSEIVYQADKSDEKVLSIEYVRDGDWKVYFNSPSKTLRSKGSYKSGKRHGEWFIYAKSGKVRYEFEFREGLLKTKTVVKEDGSQQTVIQKNEINLFVEKNMMLLIAIFILPINALRLFLNIHTYNEIYGTNYNPLVRGLKRGEQFTHLYCMLVFWWISKSDDTEEIKKLKRSSNRVSGIAVLCIAALTLILVLFLKLDA